MVAMKAASKWCATARGVLRWLVKRKTVFINADFTRRLVKHYCAGIGCEIGPGANPQTNPNTTYYVDRYRTYNDLVIESDLVANASALPFASASLDYLVSSHVLEHCPDALATLEEWLRALKPGGRMVLRLPHGLRTFDRGRALTTLDHHISDYGNRVGPMDPTHWDEFERISIPGFAHHWEREALRPNGSHDFAFVVRHGHMHYHVWTQTEMLDVLRHLGCLVLLVIDKALDREDSFCIVCEKVEPQAATIDSVRAQGNAGSCGVLNGT